MNLEPAIQSLYQDAIKFATAKHQQSGQPVPGTDLPYNVHLSCVAMEVLVAALHTPGFDLSLGVQAALLHDVLEDTATTAAELQEKFGAQVTAGVQALTKNHLLPNEQQMGDSLARIKQQPLEIWAVKLADRITNLQKPPAHWTREKMSAYREEARLILQELHAGNAYLANRLESLVEAYREFTGSQSAT